MTTMNIDQANRHLEISSTGIGTGVQRGAATLNTEAKRT